MPINTKAPDYIRNAPRWQAMEDALADEDVVKGRGETYLAKTGGMEVNDPDGTGYERYKSRARMPAITSQALTGIIGLIFESDPEGVSEDVITNNGQTNMELCRDVVRGVASKGRDILVIDAPRASNGGGVPFIARYPAEALINWKTDDNNASEITLAVFAETVDTSEDVYGHDTEWRYRQYQRIDGRIEVSLWSAEYTLMEEPTVLPIAEMPIVVVGSIDNTPACDPVPLLPVARCAFAYYRKSASYEHALHLTSQPTPYVTGITEQEYDQIIAQGIGSSALWYLGNEGRAGFLEVSATGLNELSQAMQQELQQAESYAVRLTQASDTAESGAALAMRAATQHASIYSIADSVSIGITQAQTLRAQWAGQPEPERFVLNTEFSTEYAGEQMISALNGAVNSLNAPRSALFEAIRRSGLSTLTDDEMLAEIETVGAGIMLDEPSEPEPEPGEPTADN